MGAVGLRTQEELGLGELPERGNGVLDKMRLELEE